MKATVAHTTRAIKHVAVRVDPFLECIKAMLRSAPNGKETHQNRAETHSALLILTSSVLRNQIQLSESLKTRVLLLIGLVAGLTRKFE